MPMGGPGMMGGPRGGMMPGMMMGRGKGQRGGMGMGRQAMMGQMDDDDDGQSGMMMGRGGRGEGRGHGKREEYRKLMGRLDLLEARMAKIETMLERLLER